MAVLSNLRFATATLALLPYASGQVFLSPDQDIILPSSNSATNPLVWLGGNSPYFAGPNYNDVSNKVPEGCVVEQVASVSRHGSRYPDKGAYDGWVALYNKIQAADFTAEGDLAFLKSWRPVLTNPSLQIAQESPTGWKEAYDLGYRMRTKYPNLYAAGTPFTSWANLYPRVVQTAQNFVRGFLGQDSAALGQVITVNATGSPQALFDSLGPSDMCPNFVDGNGGPQGTQYSAIYLPPITARFNALITGNLIFTDSDVSSFPYLCGFESQITGILSPFCSTFTDKELEQYEYRQDLRYYYGTGPGTDLPSKMMLPFLDALIELLAQGPGVNGTAVDGSSFSLPNIIAAFANDGQMTQLVAGTGVFDDQTPLSGTEIPAVWKYVSSHFCSMRGTVAFERLRCATGSNPSSSASSSLVATSTSTSACGTAPTTTKACNRDNCFRQMLQNTAVVSGFCGSYTTSVNTVATGLPTFVSQCQGSASRISSACSCLVPATATSCSTSATPTSTSTPNDNVYIRIMLNDAVYPVPGCTDGPGKSCGIDEYKKYVGNKLKNAGDLKARCNVSSVEGTPTTLKGASFFTDLRGSWIASVKP